jgi:DNA-binding transcriptional regulator YiaG
MARTSPQFPRRAPHPAPADIRRAREAKALTPLQAAALVYAKESAWRDWEEGKRFMPMASWVLFKARVLNPDVFSNTVTSLEAF